MRSKTKTKLDKMTKTYKTKNITQNQTIKNHLLEEKNNQQKNMRVNRNNSDHRKDTTAINDLMANHQRSSTARSI